MEMVILLSKTYIMILIAILLLYMIRHYIFTFNRLFAKQRLYYQDIMDNDLPFVTIMVPMHNEELVARNVLDRLMQCDYPLDRMEVIPINDHSTDGTKEILDQYEDRYESITPYHRYDQKSRGKAHGLNEVMEYCKGEIVIIFDADYQPPRGIIRELAIGFKDPEIGAVMGRVLLENSASNVLTIMLELERSGGYQIDQQARYNMGLIPQYGGTVGAYRKRVMLDMGGFNTKVLAEDTELTYKMFLSGWKVAYANKAECYEEMPEDWMVRARQIRRWARGHNQVMFRYFIPLISSEYLSFKKKFDGIMLMFIYLLPTLVFFGIINSIFLFFAGSLELVSGLIFLLFITSLNAFGNFAPFFQIAVANFIDGRSHAIRLVPLFAFNFVFYMFYVSLGFWDAVIDLFSKREAVWIKTVRFRKEKNNE